MKKKLFALLAILSIECLNHPVLAGLEGWDTSEPKRRKVAEIETKEEGLNALFTLPQEIIEYEILSRLKLKDGLALISTSNAVREHLNIKVEGLFKPHFKIFHTYKGPTNPDEDTPPTRPLISGDGTTLVTPRAFTKPSIHCPEEEITYTASYTGQFITKNSQKRLNLLSSTHAKFSTFATDMSHDGRVIVGSIINLLEDDPINAVMTNAGVWRAAGKGLGIHLDKEPLVSNAYGVSADGQLIVGRKDIEIEDEYGLDSQIFKAVLWENDHLIYLDGNEDLEESEAYAISADKKVIVGEYNGRAALWREINGTFSDKGREIIDNSGGYAAIAVSANGNHIIIRKCSKDTDAIWQPGTGAQPLRLKEGYNDGKAYAISADGHLIVGSAQFTKGTDATENAVIWIQSGIDEQGSYQMHSLNEALKYYLPEDSYLKEITGISADGTQLVGLGKYISTSMEYAFYLYLPRDDFFWQNAQRKLENGQFLAPHPLTQG